MDQLTESFLQGPSVCSKSLIRQPNMTQQTPYSWISVRRDVSVIGVIPQRGHNLVGDLFENFTIFPSEIFFH